MSVFLSQKQNFPCVPCPSLIGTKRSFKGRGGVPLYNVTGTGGHPRRGGRVRFPLFPTTWPGFPLCSIVP